MPQHGLDEIFSQPNKYQVTKIRNSSHPQKQVKEADVTWQTNEESRDKKDKDWKQRIYLRVTDWFN